MAEDRFPSLSRRTLENGMVVIELHGDLDAHGIREIESAFGVALSDRTQHTIIDLSNVSFLGSAALAMLAAHAQFAKRGGGIFTLAAAQTRVSDVIAQSGFADVLGYYGTVDEAAAALG
jgi:anti-sigma B factor antagonist